MILIPMLMLMFLKSLGESEKQIIKREIQWKKDFIKRMIYQETTEWKEICRKQVDERNIKLKRIF